MDMSPSASPHQPRASRQPSRRPTVRRATLALEQLEDRCLLNCTTISGFVFHDTNNNGLFDPGETPLANSQVRLVNSANSVIGTATTDANGYYLFNYDATIDVTPTTTAGASTVFSVNKTNQIQVGSLPQFNPALGTLTEVDLSISGQISSRIQVENRDPSPTAITGTVAGKVAVAGPDFNTTIATTSSSQTFSASGFDGQLDYAGSSGRDFGWVTVPGSSTFALNSASALADYTGTGQVTVYENATANSAATGGGNLTASINSTGGATISVVYHYIPENCIAPGAYTIVQTVQPQGYLPGKVSSNGVVLPGSIGTRAIQVNLPDNGNLTNNDFGHLIPAKVGGFVYYDVNNDGIKAAGEPGIRGATVILTGTDLNGGIVNVTQTTVAAGPWQGLYYFQDLLPGTYAITETQPGGYADGKDTIGSQGGVTSNDVFSGVVLAEGTNGINNNFGEILPADVAIVKTASPTTVAVGAPVTYTLTITNNGPAAASNLVVQDQIPAGETFDLATSGGWVMSLANGILTATLPGLANGASSVITIHVHAPQTVGIFPNTATVSSSTPDSNPNNNTSQAAITTVQGKIDSSSGSLDVTVSIPRTLQFVSKSQFIPGPGSTGPDAYVIGADNALYKHNDVAGWKKLGDNLRSVQAVAEPATGNVVVFAVTTAGGLYRYDAAAGWSQLGAAGTIRAISGGTDPAGRADVFVMTAGSGLSEYTTTGWSTVAIPGQVQSVVAADQGRAVVVLADGSVFGFNVSYGWYRLTSAGFAQSIALSADEYGNLAILAVSNGGALYRHDDATGWISLSAPGTVNSVSGGTDSHGYTDVVAVMLDGSLDKYSPQTGWQTLVSPGGGIAVACATDDDFVFASTTDGSFLEYSREFGWQRLTSSAFVHLPG